MSEISDQGLRKSYLFDNAPETVRESLCVFEVAPEQSGESPDSALSSAMSFLCGAPVASMVSHDCGGEDQLPRSDEDGFDPPEGNAAPRPRPIFGAPLRANAPTPITPPGDRAIGPRDCDVCVEAVRGEVFINLPYSFLPASPEIPLILRFAEAGIPELSVFPPANAQAFSIRVPNVPDNAHGTISAPATSATISKAAAQTR